MAWRSKSLAWLSPIICDTFQFGVFLSPESSQKIKKKTTSTSCSTPIYPSQHQGLTKKNANGTLFEAPQVPTWTAPQLEHRHCHRRSESPCLHQNPPGSHGQKNAEIECLPARLLETRKQLLRGGSLRRCLFHEIKQTRVSHLGGVRLCHWTPYVNRQMWRNLVTPNPSKFHLQTLQEFLPPGFIEANVISFHWIDDLTPRHLALVRPRGDGHSSLHLVCR